MVTAVRLLDSTKMERPTPRVRAFLLNTTFPPVSAFVSPPSIFLPDSVRRSKTAWALPRGWSIGLGNSKKQGTVNSEQSLSSTRISLRSANRPRTELSTVHCSLQYGDSGDPLLPLGGAGVVDARAF